MALLVFFFFFGLVVVVVFEEFWGFVVWRSLHCCLPFT